MSLKFWLTIVAVTLLLVIVLQFFRYDVQISENGETVIKVDRLTGEVLYCKPAEAGCSRPIVVK